MWRLIYFENGRKYQTIDSNSSIEIIASEGILRRSYFVQKTGSFVCSPVNDQKPEFTLKDFINKGNAALQDR